jgi:hypothetical protein
MADLEFWETFGRNPSKGETPTRGAVKIL